MTPGLNPDDPLRRLLETGTDEEIVLVLAGKDAQEVADLLEDLPEEVSTRAFEALGIQRQAKVLREIDDDDVREDIIEALTDDELADIAEVRRAARGSPRTGDGGD
jgi:Mg/Co/Ni transporter MgtE